MCDNRYMRTMFVQTLIDYAGAILPWLVLGSFIAYAVERRFSEEGIRKYLGVMTFKKLLFVQALGMVSPLSIMSQLPVAGSLVRLGAHPALLLSFFIAERAYDFQSFPIITGLFGLQFAVINALAIFISLSIAAFATHHVPITVKKRSSSDGGNFWIRQGRIAGIVLFGIILGAALRTFTPEDAFREIAGTPLGGTATAVLVGFVLYFGTILGNYPVAKAFADLGMHQAGVFAFMTVSPVFNLVVMFLFASAVPFRYSAKQFTFYAFVALIFTALFFLLV